MMKTCFAFIACLTFTPVVFAADSAPAAPEGGVFTGTVTQTTNTAGYTYLEVNTGSKKLWAAAPQFGVKVGDTVRVPAGTPMPNYHSKTMNRDFDLVYFTDNVQVNRGATGVGEPSVPPQLPKGHPPIGGSAQGGSPHGGMPSAQVVFTGLKKAAGGKTVSEIISDAAKLSGKEVGVRGKVVKYNGDIMGKNWLHIQDGTGKPGSNDLLVTTGTPAKVGDTVLVSGKVATKKDFGAGYKYDVMIEDAQVAVE
jgi:hypothetical protein